MNSKEYVITTIASIVGADPQTLTEETKLVDVVADSIKLFELFIRLESELQGALTYDQVAHIKLVR